MDTKAFQKISYGLFVLTVSCDGKDNGCIINTVTQVANNPDKITISVSKANYTTELIEKSKKFTVSVISTDADFEMFKHFGFCSGRDCDKFADFPDVERLENGTLAVTKNTNAYISANVTDVIDLGSHMLFVAEVTDMKVLNNTSSATYEYYHKNIKPAPKDKPKKGKTIWRCKICGYEYEGEELPEDFVCPLCKHPASDFEKIEG